MDSQKQNVEVVETYFSSINNGDLATIGNLLAEDVVWHQPGQARHSKTYRGKQEVYGLFGQFMENSEAVFKIDEVKAVMANEDMVSAILHFSAQKPNASLSMDGVYLMKVEDGKIKEVWVFYGDQAAEDDFWK